MNQAPVEFRIQQSLKLTEHSATIGDLKGERAYSPANDPVKKLFANSRRGEPSPVQPGRDGKLPWATGSWDRQKQRIAGQHRCPGSAAGQLVVGELLVRLVDGGFGLQQRRNLLRKTAGGAGEEAV